MKKFMKYLALLRGINVGGKNKIAMSDLASIFQNLGFQNVQTYINTGNVIFETESLGLVDLTKKIEDSILQNLGLNIKVHVVEFDLIIKVWQKTKADWTNDKNQKTDVLFLWSEVNSPESINQIETNPAVDNLLFFQELGVLVWNIDKLVYKDSGMHKFVGTKIYKSMTARNINTIRKIAEL